MVCDRVAGMGFAAALAILAAIGHTARAEEPVDFRTQIQPIFVESCYDCHGPSRQRGNLRLDIKSAVFHEERDKWTIVPGDAEASSVYKLLILDADDFDLMPADGDPLPEEQIALIKRWIDEGANWPDDDPETIQRLRPAQIELPELTAEQQAAETAALHRLASSGVLAMRIAANTSAVDVNLSLLGEAGSDEHLAGLDGLQQTLVWLNLARTSVTDEGLAALPAYTELRRLHLANTGVGDAGLAHIARLPKLEYLNLYGTKVTDAGLTHLRELPHLRRLFLWQTEVTQAGVAALQEALPHVQVDLGDYGPLVAVGEQVQPINANCPVSGRPVDVEFTVTHEGHTIGFCCNNCKGRFEQNPAEFIAKVAELQPQPEPVAERINDVCPFNGREVDPDVTTTYMGKIIAFCCNNCKARFEENPEEYQGKVAEVERPN